MLGGTTVASNAEVVITDVGEDGDALLCGTNAMDCCDVADGIRRGEWLFPNNTQVGTVGGVGDFYRNRGTAVVRLNRRNNAIQPTGLYCCEIDTARICVTLSKYAT